MTDDTFQKYDFYHRAKGAFLLRNLVDYHKDFEDIKDIEVKKINADVPTD